MSEMIDALKKLLDIPPAIMARFSAPSSNGPQQTLITVTSEIKLLKGKVECQLKSLEGLIEETLGNPAKTDFKLALDNTGIVHFASLSVIRGAKDAPHEPSYLFLEMSADGTESEILEHLCQEAGHLLQPIYERAGCMYKKETLELHLRRNSVHLIQSPWPGFFAGHLRNGLGFSGTPGQSVKNILADESLASKAQDKITRPKNNESPLQTLERVREELVKEGEHIPFRAPPLFAEDTRSYWRKKPGLLTTFTEVFPPTYYGLIIVLFLTMASSFWAIMFPVEGKPDDLKHLPLNFSIRPSDLSEYKIFLSPLYLFYGLLSAFLSAALISGITHELGLQRLRNLGAVIWYLLISCILVGLWRFELFAVSLKVDPSPDWNLLMVWCFAAFITILFYSLSKASKRLRKITRPATWVAMFLMAVIFLEVAQTHWNLFNIRELNDGKAGIFNRWSHASFPQMVFYPGLYASLLITSVIAVDAATPGIGAWIKPKLSQTPFFKKLTRFTFYILLFLLLHSLIYLFAFFGLEDLKEFYDNKYWFVLSWILIPLVMAFVVICIYFGMNKSLKKTLRKFLYCTVGLSCILALIINFKPLSLLEKSFKMPPGVQLNWGNEKVLGILQSLIVSIPITFLVIIAIILLFLFALRISEKKNTPATHQPTPMKIRKLMSHENQNNAQNHMLVIGRLLPEQFRRRFTLPISLNFVKKRIAKHARPGFLGKIKTVHYARWIHFPRTNNYGFFANYDGSFESYMEDFVTKGSDGLNLVSSHTEGYPETEFIVKKGAADGDAFKSYLRDRFVSAPMWYAAYPSIPAEQIRINSLIVHGLSGISLSSDAESWLDLFSSIPRPEHALETHKIQNFVFGTANHLQAGCCISIICPEGCGDSFRSWVKWITPDVTFGDQVPETKVCYLAFSNAGFERLGVVDILNYPKDHKNWQDIDPDAGKMQKMNSAFTLGMDDPTRASVLGDIDENAPSEWDWGTGEKIAHAVLVVKMSGTNPDNAQKKLNRFIKEQKNILGLLGLRHGKIINLRQNNTKTAKREPFGFIDGISQPILRGTQRATVNPGSIHLVEPGEIILGYRDNRGYFPKSPIMEARFDPKNILPATPNNQPARYPKFQTAKEDTARDFGRNGTFLVIRQLEQDFRRFEIDTDRIASKLTVTGITGDGLRAKLMGRWQDGGSLIKYPITLKQNGTQRVYQSPNINMAETDNEFLFGRDDPQGHACPYGAHIRRANPRDGLDPKDEDGLSITNRHRILRRGFTYCEGVKQKDDDRYEKEGTCFMALNANIERQFEFVQQTWSVSKTFHGLRNEVDPVHTKQTQNGEFTIQAPGKPVVSQGLSSYVTMKGGGYFFLPGRDALNYIGVKR